MMQDERERLGRVAYENAGVGPRLVPWGQVTPEYREDYCRQAEAVARAVLGPIAAGWAEVAPPPRRAAPMPEPPPLTDAELEEWEVVFAFGPDFWKTVRVDAETFHRLIAEVRRLRAERASAVRLL